MNHSYKAYSRATHTVAKTRQVVMLYDGAIRFLNQAKDAMEKNEIERRFKALSKASEILSGLQACLDFEAGGQAAHTLNDFYSAMDMRIMQMHRTNDAAECAKVVEELKSMREVWNVIDQNGGGEKPAAAAAPVAHDPSQPVTVRA